MSEKMVGNIFAAKWTPEHDATLRRLREDGYSSSQIADGLWSEFRTSYSRNAVIGRSHRLGLTNPEVFKPRITKSRTDRPCRPLVPKHNSEEAVMRCIEIEPRHLTLLQLAPTSCRYPYGDGPFTFCGHPKMEGDSYCGPHLSLCTGIGTTSERRASA